MIGAIAGDIIGSVYERFPIKSKEFPLFRSDSCFTDDTVLTVAVADAILTGCGYQESIIKWGRRYPHAGYGGFFRQWLYTEDPQPYNSWGNGSAMRVSAIGFAFDNEERVLEEAARSASVTHNHPEGVKGAQATALAILYARTGHDKAHIREIISTRFAYDLDRTVDEIRPGYSFQVSCQKTVPEAIIAFLDASSYEDALRNAISLGGDSDTLACITGGIAQAFYGGPSEEIEREVRERLTPDLISVTKRFSARYLDS